MTPFFILKASSCQSYAVVRGRQQQYITHGEVFFLFLNDLFYTDYHICPHLDDVIFESFDFFFSSLSQSEMILLSSFQMLTICPSGFTKWAYSLACLPAIMDVGEFNTEGDASDVDPFLSLDSLPDTSRQNYLFFGGRSFTGFPLSYLVPPCFRS